MPDHHHDPYGWLAPWYDAVARLLLLPFGGEFALRRRALVALEVRPGTRVLELGCGTGTMATMMLSLGADVDGVDLSLPMLRRARRKAPRAQLVHGDVLAVSRPSRYDLVLLSFVLHEMDADTRLAALRVAAKSVVTGGAIGIVDFASPRLRVLDLALRVYLRASEPETARDLIDGGLERDMALLGWRISQRTALAGGAAKCVALRVS